MKIVTWDNRLYVTHWVSHYKTHLHFVLHSCNPVHTHIHTCPCVLKLPLSLFPSFLVDNFNVWMWTGVIKEMYSQWNCLPTCSFMGNLLTKGSLKGNTTLGKGQSHSPIWFHKQCTSLLWIMKTFTSLLFWTFSPTSHRIQISFQEMHELWPVFISWKTHQPSCQTETPDWS